MAGKRLAFPSATPEFWLSDRCTRATKLFPGSPPQDPCKPERSRENNVSEQGLVGEKQGPADLRFTYPRRLRAVGLPANGLMGLQFHEALLPSRPGQAALQHVTLAVIQFQKCRCFAVGVVGGADFRIDAGAVGELGHGHRPVQDQELVGHISVIEPLTRRPSRDDDPVPHDRRSDSVARHRHGDLVEPGVGSGIVDFVFVENSLYLSPQDEEQSAMGSSRQAGARRGHGGAGFPRAFDRIENLQGRNVVEGRGDRGSSTDHVEARSYGGRGQVLPGSRKGRQLGPDTGSRLIHRELAERSSRPIPSNGVDLAFDGRRSKSSPGHGQRGPGSPLIRNRIVFQKRVDGVEGETEKASDREDSPSRFSCGNVMQSFRKSRQTDPFAGLGVKSFQSRRSRSRDQSPDHINYSVELGDTHFLPRGRHGRKRTPHASNLPGRQPPSRFHGKQDTQRQQQQFAFHGDPFLHSIEHESDEIGAAESTQSTCPGSRMGTDEDSR